MQKTLKLDNKGRITIGKHTDITGYRADFRPSGEIVLVPMVEIPQREKWLYADTSEAKKFSRAMNQVKKGKVVRKKVPTLKELEDLENDGVI